MFALNKSIAMRFIINFLMALNYILIFVDFIQVNSALNESMVNTALDWL